MPSLSAITATFFVNLINRLGVRPAPPDGFQLINTVQPVSLVDADISLSSIQSTALLDTTNTQGELVAPLANAVIADTGALAAGNYQCTVVMTSNDGTIGNSGYRIQRRDAANATSIWSQLMYISSSGQKFIFGFRAVLSAGERIRIVKDGTNQTAGAVCQGSIWVAIS